MPALLALCLLFGVAGGANAQVSAVYSAAAVEFHGPIDVAAMAPVGADIASGTSVPAPGLPCVTVTLSNASGYPLQRLDQGNGWMGNFAPGTPLLWTGGRFEGGLWVSNGPLTLQFSAVQTTSCTEELDSQVTAVGFQIQADLYGAFTAELCAYDATDNVISCQEFTGSSTGNGDGTALFVGLLNSDPNQTQIAKVTVKTGSDDFAISGPLLAVASGTGDAAPSGLVGWWKFDESYGITANDSSGFGNHGRLSGAALFKPDGNGANVLAIQAASGQVHFPFSSVLNPVNGTVAIWVKPGRQQNADIVWHPTDLLARSNCRGTYYAYGLKITHFGQVVAILANDDPGASLRRPQILLPSPRHLLHPNRWTHVAMTWNGRELSLYINGRKVGSTPYDPNPETGLSYHGADPLRVAGSRWDREGGHLEYFGALSDLRIYARALTDAEIESVYQSR